MGTAGVGNASKALKDMRNGPGQQCPDCGSRATCGFSSYHLWIDDELSRQAQNSTGYFWFAVCHGSAFSALMNNVAHALY